MCRAQPEGWKPTTQHVTPDWTVSRAEVHEARWAARSHRSEGPERARGTAPPHGRCLSRPNPWAHRTPSQQPFWQVWFSVEAPLAPHLLGKNSTDVKTDSSLMPRRSPRTFYLQTAQDEQKAIYISVHYICERKLINKNNGIEKNLIYQGVYNSIYLHVSI